MPGFEDALPQTPAGARTIYEGVDAQGQIVRVTISKSTDSQPFVVSSHAQQYSELNWTARIGSGTAATIAHSSDDHASGQRSRTKGNRTAAHLTCRPGLRCGRGGIGASPRNSALSCERNFRDVIGSPHDQKLEA